LHHAIYARAIETPGIVVLHDAVLQHFYLGSLDESRYIEEYVYNYGEWERSVAVDLYRQRASSGMDLRYFDRPMLKRAALRSLAVVVHNPAAAQAVREHAPQARVIEIPHFFDCPQFPDAQSRSRLRSVWNLTERDFVFGVFGYLRESKRLLPILESFAELHRDHPGTRLLIAGSFASPDLERAAAPYLALPGVIRLGHLGDQEFWRVANAVDACLNLRYPAAAETSGIGVRLMGLGKPVFFTAGREIEAIPTGACIRVAPGPAECAELLHLMRFVVQLPELAQAIGVRAASHVRSRHALEGIAEQYWDSLCAMRALSR